MLLLVLHIDPFTRRIQNRQDILIIIQKIEKIKNKFKLMFSWR